MDKKKFNKQSFKFSRREMKNEILQKANISELKLKTEFALFLYEKNILTLEQASKVADKDTLEFQLILGSRKIPIHYGVEDFENDLKTLKKLNRITKQT